MMPDSNAMSPIQVGLDDGYAFTKVALPDGRLIAIPSRARVGKSGVTWIHEGQQRIFEYETEGTVYSVGTVDGEPTNFEGYPTSGMNRAIVQHALQKAGLTGRSVHAVSGLPVSAFYKKNGEPRRDAIVILPDHLHTIWTLPRGDADFSTRWKRIKRDFTVQWLAHGGIESKVTDAQARRGTRGVWQRRFYEHQVRDEAELSALCDYIHYNPVKHRHAQSPRDWPYSSFHRFVSAGHYSAHWGRHEIPHIDDLE